MTARFLIVEDNPLNLQLVRDILEYRGHDVVVARTLSEARDRLEEAPVDVVVLDVQIPGGGGENFLKDFRSTPATAGLPVIAVTALAMDGDRDRLLAAGFDGYLSKPIDTRTFGPAVESYLRGERGDDGD